MKCKHKYIGIGSVGCYCIVCGEYKGKPGVYMKRFVEKKVMNIVMALLLIGLGLIIGMGMMILQIGGSWEYRVKSIENTVGIISSSMERINEVNERIDRLPWWCQTRLVK